MYDWMFVYMCVISLWGSDRPASHSSESGDAWGWVFFFFFRKKNFLKVKQKMEEILSRTWTMLLWLLPWSWYFQHFQHKVKPIKGQTGFAFAFDSLAATTRRCSLEFEFCKAHNDATLCYKSFWVTVKILQFQTEESGGREPGYNKIVYCMREDNLRVHVDTAVQKVTLWDKQIISKDKTRVHHE